MMLLTNMFFIVLGKKWSSIEQRNNNNDTQYVLVGIIYCWLYFLLAFVDPKK